MQFPSLSAWHRGPTDVAAYVVALVVIACLSVAISHRWSGRWRRAADGRLPATAEARWAVMGFPGRPVSLLWAFIAACSVLLMTAQWLVGYVIAGALSIHMLVELTAGRARRRRALLQMLAEERYLRCPMCLYCLQSLAARGRCPECGEPYDVEQLRQTWHERLGT